MGCPRVCVLPPRGPTIPASRGKPAVGCVDAEPCTPGVDAYIDRSSPRGSGTSAPGSGKLIWEADPDIEETIKRSVQPYFVLGGNVCALLATKDHINLFLYDPTVADPDGIINQGEGNKTARAIQIFRGDRRTARG